MVKFGNFSPGHKRFFIFCNKMWILHCSVLKLREPWAEQQGLGDPKWLSHSLNVSENLLGPGSNWPHPRLCNLVSVVRRILLEPLILSLHSWSMDYPEHSPMARPLQWAPQSMILELHPPGMGFSLWPPQRDAASGPDEALSYLGKGAVVLTLWCEWWRLDMGSLAERHILSTRLPANAGRHFPPVQQPRLQLLRSKISFSSFSSREGVNLLSLPQELGKSIPQNLTVKTSSQFLWLCLLPLLLIVLPVRFFFKPLIFN